MCKSGHWHWNRETDSNKIFFVIHPIKRAICPKNEHREWLASLDVSQNTKLKFLNCTPNKILLSGRQLDLSQHDPNFRSDKVTGGLFVHGNVVTLPVNGDSCFYYYDCGNNHKMYVIVETTEKLPFSDVQRKSGDWKYESIKYVNEHGIMGSVGGSDKFQPDAPLTRAMFAAVLHRMAGEPSIAYTKKFSDVPDGQWYSQAILWAAEQNIVNGYGNGSYGKMLKMFMEGKK